VRGDRHAAARIVYEAFAGIHGHNRSPRNFPTLEAATELRGRFVAHPLIPSSLYEHKSYKENTVP
jgi:hypothetical protein